MCLRLLLAVWLLFVPEAISSQSEQYVGRMGNSQRASGLEGEVIVSILPSFTWIDSSSIRAILPNGVEDIIQLWPAEKVGDLLLPCLFEGKLKEDDMSAVAVSGCQHDDSVRIDIYANFFQGHAAVFTIKNGITEEIGGGNIGKINDVIENQERRTRRKRDGNSGILPVPPFLLYDIKFGYEESLLAKLGSHEAAQEYIMRVFTLAKVTMQHPSLGTQIRLRAQERFQFVPDVYWSGANQTSQKTAMEEAKTVKQEEDMPVMFFIGTGPLGGAFNRKGCDPREGIAIQPHQDDLQVAIVRFLHDVGHWIGLRHDEVEDRKHGTQCAGTGLMSEQVEPEKRPLIWSSCSQSAFSKWFHRSGSCLKIDSDSEFEDTERVYLNTTEIVKPEVTLRMEPESPVDHQSAITLFCADENNQPLTTVQFFKDGVLLANKTRCSLFDLDPEKLVLGKAEKQLVGNFACIGVNEAGESEMSEESQLEIHYPPGQAAISKNKDHVVKGDNLTLSCDVKDLGHPPANKFIWTINGTPSTAVNSPEWSINNVNSSIEGTISCKAENIIGQGVEDSMNIDVIVKPEVTVIMYPESPVDELANVTISCHDSSGQSLKRVQWFKDGEMVCDRTQCTSICDLDPEKFVLKNIERQNRGKFSCIGFNEAGKSERSQESQLEVNYPPGKATISKKEDLVIKGNSLTLTCDLADMGNPPAHQFIWTVGQPGYLERHNTSEPKLIIDVTRKTGGRISCAAQSTFGIGVEDSMNIDILVRPSFVKQLDSHTELSADTNYFKLTCEVESKPTATIQWFKDGKPIANSSQYTIQSVNVVPDDYKFESVESSLNFWNVQNRPDGKLDPQNDPGSYTCLSSANVVGEEVNSTTELIILAPPKLVVALVPHTVVSSNEESFDLICEVESSPAVAISWLRNGYPIWTGDDRYSISSSDGKAPDYSTRYFPSKKSVLTLNRPIDGATYSCKSSYNSVDGSVTSETHLSIEYPPQELNVAENSWIDNLECDGAADFVWRRNGREIDTQGNHQLQFSSPIAREDGGEYVCEARHGQGAKKTTIINVEYKPECSIRYEKTADEIILTCEADANPTSVSFTWKKDNYELLNENNAHLNLDTLKNGTYSCIVTSTFGKGIPCSIDLPLSLVHKNEKMSDSELHQELIKLQKERNDDHLELKTEITLLKSRFEDIKNGATIGDNITTLVDSLESKFTKFGQSDDSFNATLFQLTDQQTEQSCPNLKRARIELFQEENDTTQSREGTVVIRDDVSGNKGTICHEGADDKTAEVICKMMGFSDPVLRRGPHSQYQIWEKKTSLGNLDYTLADVKCEGTEDNIMECQFKMKNQMHCPKGLAAVSCACAAEKPSARSSSSSSWAPWSWNSPRRSSSSRQSQKYTESFLISQSPVSVKLEIPAHLDPRNGVHLDIEVIEVEDNDSGAGEYGEYGSSNQGSITFTASHPTFRSRKTWSMEITDDSDIVVRKSSRKTLCFSSKCLGLMKDENQLEITAKSSLFSDFNVRITATAERWTRCEDD